MKTLFLNLTLFGLLNLFCLNAHAEWLCYAADKGGHLWRSNGLTENNATTVAISFCKAFSPNAGSCHLSKCLSN